MMTFDPPSVPRQAKLDAQLCFALFNATNAVLRAYSSRLRLMGLDYQQYLILLALWQGGAATVNGIAERLSIAPGIVDKCVEHLQRADLATCDRDTMEVTLSEAGVELEGAVFDMQQEVNCSIDMERETFDFVRSELEALAHRVTKADAVSSPGDGSGSA